MYNSEYYERGLRAATAGLADHGALNGRRILITGATGLIGSYLVDALVLLNEEFDAGMILYAAGRSEARVRARFANAADRAYFHYVPYDAAQTVQLDLEVDAIIHAATNAHPLAYATDPVGIMKANLLGTMGLLEHLRSQRFGRFLMLSTGEVYGENPDLPEGFSEEDHGWVDPMTPRACYPESKRAAETLCTGYAAQYGVDALAARLCHVYGPTFTASNSRADAQFLRKALAGEDIVLKSAGSQVRSYCYVADAVRALMTILAVGEKGQAYNVANRRSVVSIREYAETLAQLAGVSVTFDLPPETERAGYTRITRAVLNPAKLEALGWTPAYDLREGLAEALMACRT